MIISDLLAYVDAVKPNSFDTATKITWLNEVEGMVETDIMLVASADIITYAAADAAVVLLVPAPHDKLYRSYLCAMVDFANGEYTKYNNAMQMFNTHYRELVEWYARVYRPADGVAVWQGYYISAYGIAVSHGYTGDEVAWLLTLKGATGAGTPGINGTNGTNGGIGNTGAQGIRGMPGAYIGAVSPDPALYQVWVNPEGVAEYVVNDLTPIVNDTVTGGATSVLSAEVGKNLNSQLADIGINVKNYGAKGDGVTNDTIAIQNAINAENTVVFGSGTFVHTTLYLKTSTKLIGQGNATILKNNANVSSIVIPNYTTASDTLISNLYLMGNGANTNSDGIEFTGANAAYCIIDRVKITGFGRHGIHGGHVGHVNNVEIRGCFIQGCIGDGINMQYGVGQVNAIWIHHNNIVENNNGILFFGNNVIVESNTIQANRNYGISLSDMTLDTRKFCLGSSITKNYFEGNASSVSSNASIIGIFTCYLDDGLDTDKVLRQLSISNNYFYENGIKYISVIYCEDLKDSNKSSKNCVFQTYNNYAEIQLLTFNKTSALSLGCAINENYYALVPISMQLLLPSYVQVKGNYLSEMHNNLTLLNGWISVVGTKTQYFLDDNEIVHLRGSVKDGTGIIFTLPALARPKYPLTFPVLANNTLGVLGIAIDGNVSLISGSNINVALDGITFSADDSVY